MKIVLVEIVHATLKPIFVCLSHQPMIETYINKVCMFLVGGGLGLVVRGCCSVGGVWCPEIGQNGPNPSSRPMLVGFSRQPMIGT